MNIQGEIVKVICRRPNWASIVILSNKDIIKANGTIIGNVIEGNNVCLEGDFYDDPTYGRQFRVKSCKIHENLTSTGIKKFLTTFLTGVGEKTADLIINRFGKDTLDIIESDTEYIKLTEIKGITEKKANKIHKDYALNKAYVDILNFFKGNITENQAYKIFEKYEEDAIKVLKEDPYQLIYDIDGLGFKKVDKLALASGIKPDSRKRVGAAIIYTLKSLSENGDVYVDDFDLEVKVKECLTKEKLDVAVTINRLADEIIEQVKEEKLVIENTSSGVKVYLKYLHNAENTCAQIVKDMVSATPNKKDFIPQIKNAENNNEILFDEIQRDACNMVLNNLFSVITGGPGMGKTTIIKVIIEIYSKKNNVICLAPTGRAAKRMQESTGYDAKTIDSWLLSAKDIRKDTLFIVDEASMVDLVKASRLLKVISKNLCRVVFVGDIYQLPSIGAGNFLNDLIKSHIVPVTTLKYSYRFGGTIASNAKLINEGMLYSDLKWDNDMKFIEADKSIAKETIENEYRKALQEYDAKDIMVIVPMKNRSATASNALNISLRDIHNPKTRKKEDDFMIGDRVMNIHNNYQIEGIIAKTGKSVLAVYNGDTGVIQSIDEKNKKIAVLFDDGRLFEFTQHLINNLVLAYANTCHKAQGSEAKCVIIALNNEHRMSESSHFLTRNLFYTAITRGKEKVIVVGDKWALNQAIKDNFSLARHTQLSTKIEQAL